jgi:hypothetical protein
MYQFGLIHNQRYVENIVNLNRSIEKKKIYIVH